MRLALGCFLAALAFSTAAQTAPDVLRAFRKIQASTEAGVNYDEYARAVADVNAQLRSYTDNSRGPDLEAVRALRDAFAQYQGAKELWDKQRIDDELYYRFQRISVNVYFDGKRKSTMAINELWRAGSANVDRAADLMRRPLR